MDVPDLDPAVLAAGDRAADRGDRRRQEGRERRQRDPRGDPPGGVPRRRAPVLRDGAHRDSAAGRARRPRRRRAASCCTPVRCCSARLSGAWWRSAELPHERPQPRPAQQAHDDGQRQKPRSDRAPQISAAGRAFATPASDSTASTTNRPSVGPCEEQRRAARADADDGFQREAPRARGDEERARAAEQRHHPEDAEQRDHRTTRGRVDRRASRPVRPHS